jgi:hypothetical protein
MLAAINLPGLVQRRKTEDDYSEMNLYFKKGKNVLLFNRGSLLITKGRVAIFYLDRC